VISFILLGFLLASLLALAAADAGIENPRTGPATVVRIR
jgi:hypothetical protein